MHSLYSDYLHGTEGDCPIPTYHARAQRLTSWGFVCVGIDHQGHGKSEGTRAHMNSLDDLVDDASDYLQGVVVPAYPDLPIFLFGESMGGL